MVSSQPLAIHLFLIVWPSQVKRGRGELIGRQKTKTNKQKNLIK
jgi:hypothetical protein